MFCLSINSTHSNVNFRAKSFRGSISSVSLYPSLSSSVSSLSPIPSKSWSACSFEFSGKWSSVSLYPSLSSSISPLSPIPSLSLSFHSFILLGNSSTSFGTPSKSLSCMYSLTKIPISAPPRIMDMILLLRLIYIPNKFGNSLIFVKGIAPALFNSSSEHNLMRP